MTFQPVNYWLVHMYIPCFVASVTDFLEKKEGGTSQLRLLQRHSQTLNYC